MRLLLKSLNSGVSPTSEPTETSLTRTDSRSTSILNKTPMWFCIETTMSRLRNGRIPGMRKPTPRSIARMSGNWRITTTSCKPMNGLLFLELDKIPTILIKTAIFSALKTAWPWPLSSRMWITLRSNLWLMPATPKDATATTQKSETILATMTAKDLASLCLGDLQKLRTA